MIAAALGVLLMEFASSSVGIIPDCTVLQHFVGNGNRCSIVFPIDPTVESMPYVPVALIKKTEEYRDQSIPRNDAMVSQDSMIFVDICSNFTSIPCGGRGW